MSTSNTISGLPAASSANSSDVFPVVQNGNTYKLTLSQITEALAAATPSSSGIMSATDKTLLTALQAQVANLEDSPKIVTVPSAPTISIPNDSDVIILTGSTNIGTITDAVDYKVYVLYYPSGPGISVLGAELGAQGVLVLLHTP
jgi:hypothetical protein